MMFVCVGGGDVRKNETDAEYYFSEDHDKEEWMWRQKMSNVWARWLCKLSEKNLYTWQIYTERHFFIVAN